MDVFCSVRPIVNLGNDNVDVVNYSSKIFVINCFRLYASFLNIVIFGNFVECPLMLNVESFLNPVEYFCRIFKKFEHTFQKVSLYHKIKFWIDC